MVTRFYQDPKKHPVVIGCTKCGQISLAQYLQRRFHTEVPRFEVFWRRDGPDVFENEYGEHDSRQPYIILRNPVDRIWSCYFYFRHNKTMKISEYLEHEAYDEFVGEENPIKQSDYTKFIELYLQFEPVILKLEDMKRNSNFPHRNKTDGQKGLDFYPMSKHDRCIISSKLEEEGLLKY